jgi:hypothetical protein
MSEPAASAALTLFDYKALDTETRDFVAERTERIRTRLRRAVEDIVGIGSDLLAVKDRLPHGQFLAWLAAECEMSERTAYNWMNVAAKFATVASLEGISPRALYMLAAPSTPSEAVEEALAAAATGETVGPAQAEAIIERHKGAPEAKPDELPTYSDDELDGVLVVRDDQVAADRGEETDQLPYPEAEAAVQRLEEAVDVLVSNDPAVVFAIRYPALTARVEAAGARLRPWLRDVMRTLDKAS